MATDLFDPADINAAVGEAFGVKPKQQEPVKKQPSAAFSTQAPARQASAAAVTDELLNRLKKVESGGDVYALNKKTKAMGPYQFMPETVQMLHKQGMKFNPFDEQEAREAARVYLTQLTQRHNGNIDLALKDYGGFVTKDPTKYVKAVSGNALQFEPQQQAPSPQKVTQRNEVTKDDLMNPDVINAAVSQAFGEEPKMRGVSGSVKKFLRGSAALADTVAGVVPGVAGMVTYAGARATGKTPEEAAQAQAKVVGALDKPFGKAFGVTETPEYKGEASQQIMRFIGENVEKGADWISKKTGLPKSDVEFYINVGSLAPAGLRGTKIGQAVAEEAEMLGQTARQAGAKVLEAAKDVTPEIIQRGVSRTVEAIAPGATRQIPKASTLGGFEPSAPTMVPAPAGRASIGAAGVPDATIIKQALQSATPELQQALSKIPIEKANIPAIMRHIEADSLPYPVRLLEGQATDNPVLQSIERNIRGNETRIVDRLSEQNLALKKNLPAIAERAAPDVHVTRPIESSQALINGYKNLDAVRNKEISAAYKALEEAAGGNFPVDGAKLAKNAEAALSKKLKSDFLATPIKNQLEKFKNGERMTFEQFEAMRTNLAAEIRRAERSGDGNAAMAASIVREAMEELPLIKKSENLKNIADKARSLAKARFDQLKKDPAYKAAIEDTVPADKFLDKFVINGVNKNIQTMVNTFGRESLEHQHIKAGTINFLQDKSGVIDTQGNFSQANYNKAIKKLDDVNNLNAIFDPESKLLLETLGNVARYTDFLGKGHFANTSNTWVARQAAKAGAKLGLAGNFMGVGDLLSIKDRYRAAKSLEIGAGSKMSRRYKAAATQALEPGAGSTLNEISKKGR